MTRHYAKQLKIHKVMHINGQGDTLVCAKTYVYIHPQGKQNFSHWITVVLKRHFSPMILFLNGITFKFQINCIKYYVMFGSFVCEGQSRLRHKQLRVSLLKHENCCYIKKNTLDVLSLPIKPLFFFFFFWCMWLLRSCGGIVVCNDLHLYRVCSLSFKTYPQSYSVSAIRCYQA